ncbi:prepilin-type N-terminal cleavage/methylation domain-containing protein [Aliikangiella marina]|uniref:Prepilin-type N-terminal cleavage/methylation domain-containing protein n=1 Tax=Aliikangiella marina TaxID=1712262 RepID=A0A545TK05_9GAMM|nr:PilW family protein [Aliikangiella marina]TQV77559.1 prepilin-type N-terminal cleavage/methylation domain-containing protein [Aliikangiella marina]
MKSSFISAKQKGFSLVELMVAALLGLVLLGGVIQLFLGSNENYRMQDELASIQEDGRFALMFLNEQIEMAGWTDPSSSQVVSAIDFGNSADGLNDTIAMSYVRAIDGVNNLDCNGNVVLNGIVTNQFSVNADNELVCRGMGAGGVAQPLISGVSSFQVLYGVETELVCPDGVVDRYMTRDEVNAAGLTGNVMAVRVSLLLNSGEEILAENLTDQFQVADQNLNFNDRRVRRLFQETVFMPNSAYNILVNSDAAVKCMSGF